MAGSHRNRRRNRELCKKKRGGGGKRLTGHRGRCPSYLTPLKNCERMVKGRAGGEGALNRAGAVTRGHENCKKNLQKKTERKKYGSQAIRERVEAIPGHSSL